MAGAGTNAGDDGRELDVVVHGVTGFVGRLVAGYLAEHAPPGVRVGLSGRSVERVTQARDELGPEAAAWPVIEADSFDEVALAALAARTRVVATTVGPYDRYGAALVAACAAAGTDYLDLTGEATFMRASIDANHATAQASGARVVHASGFDSVPSDLGVHLLARAAAEHGLGTLTATRLVLTGAKGGVPGGTVETVRNQVELATHDRAARRVLADPYALSPDRDAEPDGGARPGRGGGRAAALGSLAPTYDRVTRRWLSPFVMGVVNGKVVRRSNALLGHAYGRGLDYTESVGFASPFPGPLGAVGLAAGTAGGTALMALPPARFLLDRVLPAVGAGPDEATLRDGFFALRLHSRTTSGATVQVKVRAPGDPGCAATALMMGESALALVLDRDRLPDRAGVLTPATALGDVLVGRLRAAGMTLDVL